MRLNRGWQRWGWSRQRVGRGCRCGRAFAAVRGMPLPQTPLRGCLVPCSMALWASCQSPSGKLRLPAALRSFSNADFTRTMHASHDAIPCLCVPSCVSPAL